MVLVAHSKGGLIGKLAMLREDPDGRIDSMIAVNTPFAGSSYARWFLVPSVRAFIPTDATIVALAAERERERPDHVGATATGTRTSRRAAPWTAPRTWC